MTSIERRQFLKLATALGASLAWGCASVRPSASGWRERRELFPQGVASGDPDSHSVLLWTRRPYADGRDPRPPDAGAATLDRVREPGRCGRINARSAGRGGRGWRSIRTARRRGQDR